MALAFVFTSLAAFSPLSFSLSMFLSHHQQVSDCQLPQHFNRLCECSQAYIASPIGGHLAAAKADQSTTSIAVQWWHLISATNTGYKYGLIRPDCSFKMPHSTTPGMCRSGGTHMRIPSVARSAMF